MVLIYRMFNEKSKQQQFAMPQAQVGATAAAALPARPRTVSSPIPVQSPESSRPLSPGRWPESTVKAAEKPVDTIGKWSII